VPYICLRRGYLGLPPARLASGGSVSPGGYLATSVDQLVTLLFAKYACEVAKALPSDKARTTYFGSDSPNSDIGPGRTAAHDAAMMDI
jgi:hypothetical protein